MGAPPRPEQFDIIGFSATGKETTEAEVIEFMLRGADKDGKPLTFERLELFDHLSKKNLSDLVEELNAKEAKLYIGPVGHVKNRVIRVASSVKIIVINPATHMYLAEVLHSYKGVKFFTVGKTASELPREVKLTDTRYSCSETMIDGETEIQTAIRCLTQELDLGPSEYEFILEGEVLYTKAKSGGYPNFHESSTYEYIYSQEYIRAIYTVHTEELGTKAPVIIDDHGKYSLRVWKPCLPLKCEETVGELRERGHEI